MHHFLSKPIARSLFQGWQNCTRGIGGIKPESLFHTLCYHNQMDNACTGKDWAFYYITKTILNQNFKRSLHIYKYKVTINNCKKFPRDGKNLASCRPGVAIATPRHPMAMRLLFSEDNKLHWTIQTNYLNTAMKILKRVKCCDK